MKLKLFLFTLAALLFGYFGTYAEPINGDGDTLWTKYVGDVNKIMFHPSGNSVLVASTNEFYELDAQTGKRIRKFENPFDTVPIMNTWELDVNKQGTFMVTRFNHLNLMLWDYETGLKKKLFDEPAGKANFGENGNKIFILFSSTYKNANFGVYDIEKDSIIYEKQIVVGNSQTLRSIATSPDGKYFALASVREQGGNDYSSLALYNAQTFEHIVDLVKDETGIIEEIEFSENSKWLGYNIGFSRSVAINLDKKLYHQISENYYYNNNLKNILENNKIVTIKTKSPINTIISDIETKDTIYLFNVGSSIFSSNEKNKYVAIFGYTQDYSERIFMFNSNWYYSDVPENTDTDLISNITYQNGTLKYLSILENIQSIKITDLSGKLVFQSTTTTQNNVINIALTKGIYFLTLSTDKSEYSKKFMVME